MKELLEGKRVFKQDGEYLRYLIFPAEKIKKYRYFSGEIAVKTSDLVTPNKWIRFNNTTLIEQEKFNFADYEAIFYPDKWKAKDLQEALKPHIEIQIDDDFNNLLEGNYALPMLSMWDMSEALKKEAYKDEDCQVFEAFQYTHNGELKSIIFDYTFGDHDIDGEHTQKMNEKEIQSTYRDANDEQHYLYRIDGNWYRYYPDESNQFSYLEQIWSIEDMIPFTNFQLA